MVQQWTAQVCVKGDRLVPLIVWICNKPEGNLAIKGQFATVDCGSSPGKNEDNQMNGFAIFL